MRKRLEYAGKVQLDLQRAKVGECVCAVYELGHRRDFHRQEHPTNTLANRVETCEWAEVTLYFSASRGVPNFMTTASVGVLRFVTFRPKSEESGRVPTRTLESKHDSTTWLY
jgi:hypothetical protein